MPGSVITNEIEKDGAFAPGGEYDKIVAAILTLGTFGQSAGGHAVPTVVGRYREVLKHLQK